MITTEKMLHYSQFPRNRACIIMVSERQHTHIHREGPGVVTGAGQSVVRTFLHFATREKGLSRMNRVSTWRAASISVGPKAQEQSMAI